MKNFLFALLAIASTLIGKESCDLAVCAIFRNEALYFKEWIEYHKLVGVEHFYLYNNGSDDSYLEVLDPYIKANEVTLIEWPNQNEQNWKKEIYAWVFTTQKTAYDDAVKRSKGKSKWLAAIDIDEFIVPVKAKSIPEVLAKYEKFFPGVEVCWRLYGTSHLEEIPPGKLMIEALLWQSAFQRPINRTVKTILKPDQYTTFYWPPHRCSFANGLFPYQSDPGELVINHYMNRTLKYFYTQKIAYREKTTNQKLSPKEIDDILSMGNDIEDKEKAICRFVPALRKILFPPNGK